MTFDRTRCLAGLGLLSLLVSGCSSPPGLPETLPEARAELPDAWNAPETRGSAASENDAWWNDFGIPELSKLVGAALRDSHDVRAAAARAEAAYAYAEQTGAALYPELKGDGGASASKSVNGSSGNLSRSRTYKAGLGLSWDPDFWGRNKQLRDAALKSAENKAEAERAVRLSTAGSVTRAYFGWLAANEKIIACEDNLAAAEKTLEITRAKAELGTATSAETDTAVTALENERAALASVKKQAEEYLHLLALLTANPSLSLASPAPALPETPAVRAGIPSELLQNRPDVRASARTLESVHASVAAAYAAFFPSISLTGSYGTASREFDGLFSRSVWGLGLSLDLPIFDFGRRTAAYEKTKADEREALENYRKTAESAYSEVRDALSGCRYNADLLKSREAALKSAKTAMEEARLRYESGKTGFLTLLTAQKNLNAASLALADAKNASLANIVSLNLALGAGTKAAETAE